MVSFDISNKCYEMYKLESQILKTSLYLPFQLIFEQMVKKKKSSLESYESSKSLYLEIIILQYTLSIVSFYLFTCYIILLLRTISFGFEPI